MKKWRHHQLMYTYTFWRLLGNSAGKHKHTLWKQRKKTSDLVPSIIFRFDQQSGHITTKICGYNGFELSRAYASLVQKGFEIFTFIVYTMDLSNEQIVCRSLAVEAASSNRSYQSDVKTFLLSIFPNVETLYAFPKNECTVQNRLWKTILRCTSYQIIWKSGKIPSTREETRNIWTTSREWYQLVPWRRLCISYGNNDWNRANQVQCSTFREGISGNRKQYTSNWIYFGVFQSWNKRGSIHQVVWQHFM